MTTKCATALLWGIGIAVLPEAGNAQVLVAKASQPSGRSPPRRDPCA